MLKKIFLNSFSRGNSARLFATNAPASSVVQSSNFPLQRPSKFQTEAREVWIENLDTEESQLLGLRKLHPEIFAYAPRIDLIHKNVHWQRLYKFVSFANTKTRAERAGGGRKPWPQKGLGRARAGSIRSPLFKGGGVVHGPRSPTVHFYMLNFWQRLQGLTSTLSVKLAQDDLHVVRDLEIPTDDKEYIKSLVEKRNWGPSVLFVDDFDIFPENIAIATDSIKYINLMPVYGLNVFSMLKYNTLVLTEAAVDRIEERLLFHLHRIDLIEASRKYKLSQQN